MGYIFIYATIHPNLFVNILKTFSLLFQDLNIFIRDFLFLKEPSNPSRVMLEK